MKFLKEQMKWPLISMKRIETHTKHTVLGKKKKKEKGSKIENASIQYCNLGTKDWVVYV